MFRFATLTLLLHIVSLSPAVTRECANLDIRYGIESLQRSLDNCTVVHGYLQIVLLENPSNNFTGISFPELREITGFLLLYNVVGLSDVGQLFPNLVIIRGGNLFADYSLIVYNLPHLTVLGLKNLIRIERGHVRIQSCKKLCYASTIDWSLITKYDAVGNVIQKDPKTCPNGMQKFCQDCPMKGKCWSHANCQKIIDVGDELTEHIHGVCHSQCLGKCNELDRSARGCFVCKNVRDNGVCAERCSSSRIVNKFTNRCVTEEQCRIARRVIHNRECVKECPPEFSAHESTGHCVRCKERCPKVCRGTLIQFLSAAQELKGCTIIQGNLFIKVESDVQNIEQELEYQLGDIEEITGYLKIYRSAAITSLNFLRNLKVIRGLHLENHRYSLVVFNNPNLKRMIDFTNREDLEIGNGTMSIHHNEKLCLTEIESFQKHTNIADHPENNIPYSVAATGHGHCDFKLIQSDYQILDAHNVTIYWQPFTPISNSVDGYTLHYVETTRNNLDWFNWRETCSKFSWKIRTIEGADLQFDKERQMHFYVLKDLKQVTRYAFYIRSFQFVSNSVSGQSIVKYFTTPLDILTQPMVKTFVKGQTSITLLWATLPKERRFINFYYVDVLKLPDKREILDRRNYCKNPIENDPVIQARIRKMEQNDPSECNCDENLNEEEFGNLQFDMYDKKEALYFGATTITCADDPEHEICEAYANKRFTRNLHNFERLFVQRENHPIDKRDISKSENFVASYRIDKDADYFTVPNLMPFTNYAFQFFACHNEMECSGFFYHSERTNPNLTADNLEDDDLRVHLDGQKIVLRFKEPKQPNGATLGFQIEQRVMEDDPFLHSHRPPSIVTCITRHEHERNNYSFIVSNLSPNIYGFRVKTLSLALHSSYTEWKVVSTKTDIPPPNTMRIAISFIVTFVVVALVGCGIYSYRNFSCLRKGDDTIYLMSDLEKELELEEEKSEGDFHPVDFSKRHHHQSPLQY